MIAGNLKTKVTLYKLSPDTENNNDYTFYKEIYAQVTYKTGDQVIKSHQIFNTKSVTLRIRNRKDINDLMLVQINDEVYDIVHIQPVSGINGDLLVYCVLSLKLVE